MTTAADVKVYTTNYCAYCVRAKMLLSKRGIAYEEIDVSRDDEARTWLVKTTGQRTVPQIFIHGAPIGGFEDLVRLDKSGELAKRMQLAKAG